MRQQVTKTFTNSKPAEGFLPIEFVSSRNHCLMCFSASACCSSVSAFCRMYSINGSKMTCGMRYWMGRKPYFWPRMHTKNGPTEFSLCESRYYQSYMKKPLRLKQEKRKHVKIIQYDQLLMVGLKQYLCILPVEVGCKNFYSNQFSFEKRNKFTAMEHVMNDHDVIDGSERIFGWV